MPGLNQLKQFSEDIRKVGDEAKIRAQRGERVASIPLPEGISEDDDSADFILGMPEPPAAENDEENAERPVIDTSATIDIDDIDDIDALMENDPDDSNGQPGGAEDSSVPLEDIDLDSLLKTTGDSGLDMVDESDLADFEADLNSDFEGSADSIDLNADLPETLLKNDGTAVTPEASLLNNLSDDIELPSDLQADSADVLDMFDTSALDDFVLPETSKEENVAEPEEILDAEIPAAETADSFDFDTSVLDSLDGEPAGAEIPAAETADSFDFDTSVLDSLDGEPVGAEIPENIDGHEAGDMADLLQDAEFPSAEDLDLNSIVPESSEMPDAADLLKETEAGEPVDFMQNAEFPEITEAEGASDALADIAGDDEPAAESEGSGPAENPFADFDLDSLETPAADGISGAEMNAEIPADGNPDFSMADLGDIPDFGMEDASTDADAFAMPDADSLDLPAGENIEDLSAGMMQEPVAESSADPVVDPMNDDFGSGEPLELNPKDDLAAFDTSGLDGFDFGGSGEVPDASMEVPGDDSFSSEAVPESFDVSEMAGVDFSNPAGGDDFPVTGEGPAVDDFVLDNNFEIPGFSDTETADMGKKRVSLDTVDFSGGKTGRPKNSLTDDEYVQFKKTLLNYPLNLRLAIEDVITSNEFTDEAVFELIEKILKKNSARQVATHVEKMLDIAINIPRDYERRSFAQYEAYKQSFQYQLKNRIIPAAIVGVILSFVCFGIFKASVAFIYKPVMASLNYKQGYTLLENNEFPQSEEKFNEAVSYKPVKKWFFKYAHGYREKKQYERAGLMYRNILGYFNHDKKAGLEYAEMELYDRANYERAEEIVRRQVLDYHINDADGILLLGDIFLEWAEVDESKYEDAKQEYLDLMQRYGENFLYLSRLLRYYIRTDKLREVLTMKNSFYPEKKSLCADDWTELSGYLLDKLYGPLGRNDEYLRSSIEDVLAMLELAINSNPENPLARYNLARYFVYNGYSEQAKRELEISLDLFDGLAVRTKKNVYKEINATRILGELYADGREYLKAQTVYTHGINLFNKENETTGLEGDENTGRLFADMGDIDYFISGELDSALYNYEKAISIKNDTPSLNFRVGAINYEKNDYSKALASFIKVSEKLPKDPNLLLALGNVLSLRGDNSVAKSYYSDLLKILDSTKAKQKILFPQSDEDDNYVVDMYLKANNNLGVTLYRLAKQTGNSSMNAEAMVRLSESVRAWDALTRNQKTLVRMEGSNLASQNSKYITHPYPEFEPAIYTEIPKILSDEKVLE